MLPPAPRAPPSAAASLRGGAREGPAVTAGRQVLPEPAPGRVVLLPAIRWSPPPAPGAANSGPGFGAERHILPSTFASPSTSPLSRSRRGPPPSVQALAHVLAQAPERDVPAVVDVVDNFHAGSPTCPSRWRSGCASGAWGPGGLSLGTFMVRQGNWSVTSRAVSKSEGGALVVRGEGDGCCRCWSSRAVVGNWALSCPPPAEFLWRTRSGWARKRLAGGRGPRWRGRHGTSRPRTRGAHARAGRSLPSALMRTGGTPVQSR
jgi:hypothetical protein